MFLILCATLTHLNPNFTSSSQTMLMVKLKCLHAKIMHENDYSAYATMVMLSEAGNCRLISLTTTILKDFEHSILYFISMFVATTDNHTGTKPNILQIIFMVILQQCIVFLRQNNGSNNTPHHTALHRGNHICLMNKYTSTSSLYDELHNKIYLV